MLRLSIEYMGEWGGGAWGRGTEGDKENRCKWIDVIQSITYVHQNMDSTVL